MTAIAERKENKDNNVNPKSINLIAIGYWASYEFPLFPNPKSFTGQYDATTKQNILNYLNSGSLCESQQFYAHCRFGCGTVGSKELTDRYWIWPESLAHYVEKHNIMLPPDFINHASKNQWQISGIKNLIHENIDIHRDFNFWKSYCTNPSFEKTEKLLSSGVDISNPRLEIRNILLALKEFLSLPHNNFQLSHWHSQETALAELNQLINLISQGGTINKHNLAFLAEHREELLKLSQSGDWSFVLFQIYRRYSEVKKYLWRYTSCAV